MAPEITNLDNYLTQEKDALNNVLQQIDQLCEQNKKLQGLIEIQKETKLLETEHNRSLPWFKRLINTVSKAKYIFVKSEEQLTEEIVKRNSDLLKRIDNTITSIAERSAPLKQTLQQEIRKDFEALAKKDLSETQRNRLSELFNNEYAAKPEKFTPLTMVKPLDLAKAEDLENQYNHLNTTKQNIQNLLSENSNIKEFKEIQKQVAEIRAEISATFFEKLNNTWQKIKNVFVNNNEQVLARNKENNAKTIGKIDEQLGNISLEFKGLINNNEKNINKRTHELPKDMEYKVYNSLVDLKTHDLFPSNTQNEPPKIAQDTTPKFATIGKRTKISSSVNIDKTNYIQQNKPTNDSGTEEHKKTFGSDLPTSNLPNETMPSPTFSSFGKPNPKPPVPPRMEYTTLPLSSEDYSSLEQIKSNMNTTNNISKSKLNDVASILDAKAAMSYSSTDSDSDFGFARNTPPTKNKVLQTRHNRDTQSSYTQRFLSGKRNSVSSPKR